MRSMREAMMDVGLNWSEKKCASGSCKERISLWEFRGSEDRWLWIDTEFEAGILLQIPSGYGKFQTRFTLPVLQYLMSRLKSGQSNCWPTTTRQRGKKGDHPERRQTPLGINRTDVPPWETRSKRRYKSQWRKNIYWLRSKRRSSCTVTRHRNAGG